MDELSKLRDQLDEIDEEIIQNLAKRFETIEKIGIVKKRNNLPVFDAKRWEIVIAKRKEIAKQNGISEDFIELLYNAIHEYALDIEKKLQ